MKYLTLLLFLLTLSFLLQDKIKTIDIRTLADKIPDDLTSGSILASVIGAVIFSFPAYLIGRLRYSFCNSRFKKFFGIVKVNHDHKIVVGIYDVDKTIKKFDGILYLKPNVSKNDIVGWGNHRTAVGRVIPIAETKALSYIQAGFLSNNRPSPELWDDSKAIIDYSRPLIVIGGPITNYMTRLILEKVTVIKFQITENKAGLSQAELIDQKSNKTYKLGGGFDYGIIVKYSGMTSSKDTHFVCAGIGSTGTSASAKYLMDNWRELLKNHKRNQFLIIIRVKIGIDMSTEPIEQYLI